MPVLEDPIPQLPELYPRPTPGAEGAARFQALADEWGAPLPALEQSLAQLGPPLGAIGQNLDSLDEGVAGAEGELARSELPERQVELELELGQPNPAGTKLPFDFTVPQLPAELPPSANMAAIFDRDRGTFLQLLYGYLFGTFPPG